MPTPSAAPVRKCPICGKPAVDKFAPFCSARCQDVDLNRWLSGSYRVETNEAPPDAQALREDDDEA